MPMDIDVLHVDSGGEGLERVVIETMQRSHQAQILGDTLGQGLRERVVLNREPDIVAQQIEGLQALFVIQRLAFSPAERNRTYEPPADAQGSQTLKQLRRDISIRAEKGIVRLLGQKDCALRGAERVNMARQKRDHRWLGNEREAPRRDRI